MLKTVFHITSSVLCFALPSLDNVEDFIVDATLESHIFIWMAVLSIFLISLLTLVIVVVDRRLNKILKSIVAQGVMSEFNSAIVAPRLSFSQIDSISATSSEKMGVMQWVDNFLSSVGNSRVVQMPRNRLSRILIRLDGWLTRLLGLFTTLIQFFRSFALLLGFKEVSSNRLLDPSDAGTLGDVTYMNTPKRIKRTFAKTKSNPEGGSRVKFISALQKTDTFDPPSVMPILQPPTQSALAKLNEVIAPVGSNRRTADRSLDPFRSMARQLQSKPAKPIGLWTKKNEFA
jgi:hypothetical protein